MAMWGQHEIALGHLLLNFEAQKITDLHAHFTKPWLYLLYHDRFDGHLDAHNQIAFRLAETELMNEIQNDIITNKWKHVCDLLLYFYSLN